MDSKGHFFDNDTTSRMLSCAVLCGALTDAYVLIVYLDIRNAVCPRNAFISRKIFEWSHLPYMTNYVQIRSLGRDERICSKSVSDAKATRYVRRPGLVAKTHNWQAQISCANANPPTFIGRAKPCASLRSNLKFGKPQAMTLGAFPIQSCPRFVEQPMTSKNPANIILVD